MKKLITLCLFLAAACFIPYNPASAHLITSPTDSALSGISGINFDDQALGQYESLTIGNVTFTPSLSAVAQNSLSTYPYGAYLYISDTYTGGSPYHTSGRYLNNGGYDAETPGCDIITISFATPTSAFGFSWGAADVEWTLTAYDASDNQLETYSLPSWSTDTNYFYGIAHSGITKLVLAQNHGYYGIDGGDIIFLDYPGASSAVPLPGSVLFLGTGLLYLAHFRRRKSAARV